MEPSTLEPREEATELHRVTMLIRNFGSSLAAVGPDEEKVVNAAVKSCRELLHSERCSVWLADALGSNLVLRAAEGYPRAAESIGELSYPLRGPMPAPGVTPWIHLHQVQLSADSFRDLKAMPGYRGAFDPDLYGPRSPDQGDEQHPCQQFYGGPISLGNARFGVLKVENKLTGNAEGVHRFSSTDKQVLDTVAVMLALALQYCRAAKVAQKQIQDYHAFTVHSIRNELMPFEAALELLAKNLVRDGPPNRQELFCALQFLKLGTHGLDFYMKHLLKFLHAKIDRTKMEVVCPYDILGNELWLLEECSSTFLSCALKERDQDAKTARVKADLEFFVATIKELLRNARKAVWRRREREERLGKPPTRGLVEVRLSAEDSSSQLCISISDNGDAVIDPRAQEELRKAWERLQLKDGNFTGKRGLVFANWVIAEHGGKLDLLPAREKTVFEVRLPLTKERQPR